MIYDCNECRDLAFERLRKKLDRLIETIDIKMINETNEVRKFTYLSLLEQLREL